MTARARHTLPARAPGAAAAGVLLTAGIAACAVGPDYHRPAPPAPEAWKSTIDWAPAHPRADEPRGEWWRRYDDATLTALEEAAAGANTTLAIARAQLTQARAQASIANAALLPQAQIDPDALRSRLSASRPTNGSPPTTTYAFQNQFDLPLKVSYEPDLFGGLRRGREAAVADAEASAGDLESARLIVAAEVAGDYFALREADAEVDIDAQTVAALEHALGVVRERHRVGTASGLDLAAQEAQLASVRADLADIQSQRATYENALAILCGVPAPQFHVEPAGALHDADIARVAPVPVVPSSLLERRPDVAAAERRLAAANARIGVAKAAFFPTLNLTATGGYQSVAAPLIAAPNIAWSIGAGIAAPLFDGGQRRAGVTIARAEYDAAAAQLKEATLTAFAESEDALVSLSRAGESERARQDAVRTGETTLSLATKRYDVGVASYLDLVTAQQNLLTNQRALAQAITRQRLASVLLVKSLGGDY
jgi:NodT family efflux transporter outer membrane factor (OMF) lipoprotein